MHLMYCQLTLRYMLEIINFALCPWSLSRVYLPRGARTRCCRWCGSFDAGYYSRESLSYFNPIDEPIRSSDPARVLEKAHMSTKSKGSSTACIVALTCDRLHVVKLGDTEFIGDREREGILFSVPRFKQQDFSFTFRLENGSNGDLLSEVRFSPLVLLLEML